MENNIQRIWHDELVRAEQPGRLALNVSLLLCVRRWQHFLRHARGPLGKTLCVFFLLELFRSLLEISRLFMIGKCLGIDKVLGCFNAIKLTAPGQLIVVIKRNGLARQLGLFNFVLNFISILGSVAQPSGALVLLELGANSRLLGGLSSSHDGQCASPWCLRPQLNLHTANR